MASLCTRSHIASKEGGEQIHGIKIEQQQEQGIIKPQQDTHRRVIKQERVITAGIKPQIKQIFFFVVQEQFRKEWAFTHNRIAAEFVIAGQREFAEPVSIRQQPVAFRKQPFGSQPLCRQWLKKQFPVAGHEQPFTDDFTAG